MARRMLDYIDRMNTVQVLVAVGAGVILFLFGIEHFSREVQAVSGERFRRFLGHATKNRFLGFGLGGAVTAIVQSSTATSVITVGLVNAGVMSFRHSLGVLFGANVGTTVTAQLVALKLTSFAPALLLVGFAVGYAPFKWRILGRSIFYFGLVFFSLNLVSAAVAPLESDPAVMATIAKFDTPVAALLAGAVFTAIVQSSTVTTGVAIILLERGLVPFSIALPLVLGANVGTTITALLASSSLDTPARRTAVSHALYNVGGVLLFIPLLSPFEALLKTFEQGPATTLATAHLIFNCATGALFLGLMKPFARAVEWLVKDEAGEEPLPPAPRLDDVTTDEARRWLRELVRRLRPGYTACVLALETQDKKIRSRAERISSIVRYGLEESRSIARAIARRTLDDEGSRAVLELIVTADHIRQIIDSLDDLVALGDDLVRRRERLSIESLLVVQSALTRTASMLDALGKEDEALAAHERELTAVLEDGYRRFIELSTDEREGSDLADFLSIHQRLRTKLRAFGDHLYGIGKQTLLPLTE